MRLFKASTAKKALFLTKEINLSFSGEEERIKQLMQLVLNVWCANLSGITVELRKMAYVTAYG
jgi:hypothetical protein